MLPSVVSNELRDAVSEFLRSAFPIATPLFQKVREQREGPTALIDDLVQREGALFKGPYLDIKLPFRLAEAGELPLQHLTLDKRPYRHQLDAFQRLSGDAPRSTIIATGTGSGKTECFMLPVLDDCLNRRERGIKSIVVYPMNALATDQARRFAKEVNKLDTQLTVGLFVGGEHKDASTTMGPEEVITSQDTLRENPPDILLTNYKMLDFLLIRPKDQPLWRYNTPGMLRYLVVDELHTFDGAQGTDLACLIRRLRDRLEVGPELACVGTSATMGSGSKDELLAYASEVFATELDDKAILEEDRLTPDEYLLGTTEQEREARSAKLVYFNWPDRNEARLDPAGFIKAEDYLFHQSRIWFGASNAAKVSQLNGLNPRKRAEAAVRLGKLLHQHNAFHELVRATEGLTNLATLSDEWQQRLGLPSRTHAERLLTSLISLISAARQWNKRESDDPEEWCHPLLEVRQQLWLRELRRLVCAVPDGDGRPAIRFADDLKNPQSPLHLPLLHCRECHMAAWGTVAKEGDSHVMADLQSFYQAWFQYSPQARLLVPSTGGEDVGGVPRDLCTNCLRLQAPVSDGRCSECEHAKLRRVWVPDMVRKRGQGDTERLECHHDCPECGARDSLAVMGYRAATLTSVMTGRLFATPYNDDYKLIAFSDSVQDAAHRAGFLGANTWRQVVRQAMTRWLREQAAPLSLAEMTELLPGFWRDRIGDDAHFCGLFIATNMLWLSDYRALTERGALPEGSDLPELVSKRLAWECLAEFGRRGALGRSLERTGTAAIGLEPDRLEADVRTLAQRLREEVADLRGLEDEAFIQFVVGWFQHMRQNGAIYDPVLDGYINYRGNEYQLNRLPWMPGFGRSRRPPAPVTLQHLAGNFDALTLASRDTWAVRWLKKTLARDAVFAATEARQIFHLALEFLTRSGWLVERQVSGQGVYLLNPARLMVSEESLCAECNACRHAVRFAPESRALYIDMPCLRAQCQGRLAEGAQPAGRTRDYATADPRRLVPSEHTGLLPRETREAIEHSFIEGHEPWDINLLSATPTLEMGIDIGALSSVFLCSVPPAQANYLQRIGRAGRRDGNALAVTIANGQNHDLYFYSEPTEMMAGAVHTPGVFLQALAVLERQLIAYCFDRWAASGIDESAIPGQLRQVLDALQHQRMERFPYNFLDFVGANSAGLLSGFFALFPGLEADAREYLSELLHDSGEGSLSWRLVTRLQQLVEERSSLAKRVDQLYRERKRIEGLPQDDATRDRADGVERERGALLSLKNRLNSQPALNFFTDEGLLPNYAFPEEGVTLKSVILRRRSAERRDGERTPHDEYVFQRSAQAALSELAPESRFYAISHEMQIDQVDLRLSSAEEWRFCDRCQHTERVDVSDQHSACPRCGSAQWGDTHQKHTVLKLRQVYSTVDDRTSRIGDDSEQREPQFFNRQMLVDIPPDGNHGGFRIKSDSLPFGFEFLRRATVREVNFGQRGGDSNVFSVAGRELPRRGFRICRWCGKVQKQRYRKNEYPHSYTCRLNRDNVQESEEDYFDSLYLYRELNSEAVRILLPLSEVAYSDEKLHSFIAALNLGLRRYFQGDVHHLEVTDMREPGGNGQSERVYLVIYDRIPGGTGYLKELMRAPENLMRVLEAAHERLTTCDCIEDEVLDGCYRCILAYRHSRNMPTISRAGAAQLLGEILALKDQLESVETLSKINTNVLIESKLEQRFVDALAKLPGAHLSSMMVNGKAGSLLTLPGSDGRPMPWLVEHQVLVGPDQCVALQTEIDVLLRPARAEDAARYRPIAVYTDGLQYHQDKVDDDVCKRTALLLSGRYWVFSFNWDDLPEPGKLAKPHDRDVMRLDGPAQREMDDFFDSVARHASWSLTVTHKNHHLHGAMDWLQALLREPSKAENELRWRAIHRGFTALAPRAARDTALRQAIRDEQSAVAPQYVQERTKLEESNHLPGGFLAALGNPADGVRMVASLPTEVMQAAIKQGDSEMVMSSLSVHVCFDDASGNSPEDFKANWRAFWHAVNQLQYLPNFSMATRKAISTGQLDQLWSSWEVLADSDMCRRDSPGSELGPEWDDVLEFSVLDEEQVHAIAALGVPAPEIGVDLATQEGEVVLSGDEAELVWREQQVAVVSPNAQSASYGGWRLVPMSEDVVASLSDLVNEGVL